MKPITVFAIFCAALLWLGFPASAIENAAPPILIGDINSYASRAQFTEPYKKGWQLAVSEINAKGGVLGRPLQVISRDDAGKPADATKLAEELINKDKVSVLSGTMLSNVAVAVADFAGQNKMPFLAGIAMSDSLTMGKGNPYTFRLRANSYMQGKMLAEAAAKLPAKRWATIAPNYEHGQAAVAHFKRFLTELRPDVEFVAEQWPALNKIDAGAEVQALLKAKPEGIYNVTFGSDLAVFLREGRNRGLFEGREVVSLLMGEPEYLDPLGKEAPEGWIVSGYPWYSLGGVHADFVGRYQAKFQETPKGGSLWGYLNIYAIKAAVEQAKSTDSQAIAQALRGLNFNSPLGQFAFRAIDNQGTMGYWIGKTALRNGKGRIDETMDKEAMAKAKGGLWGVMTEWHYADGADYLPPQEEVEKQRPAF